MKLLVAVDILDDAREAVVDEGARWAERLGATADLVYVSGAGSLHDVILDPEVRGLLEVEAERNRARELELLDQLLERLPAARRGRALMLPGRPADVLADTARGYDALLVATHQRKGMAHFWLGSVAEQVIRRSPVPLVTVRLGSDA